VHKANTLPEDVSFYGIS